jgi:hypothetical protein
MNRYEILLDKPSAIESKPYCAFGIENKKICPDCGHEMPVEESNDCSFCQRYLALTGRSFREAVNVVLLLLCNSLP